MPQLVMAVPQFHRPPVASLECGGERVIVAGGGKLLDPVDMPAEAVEVIEAVILHRPNPLARIHIITGRFVQSRRPFGDFGREKHLFSNAFPEPLGIDLGCRASEGCRLSKPGWSRFMRNLLCSAALAAILGASPA